MATLSYVGSQVALPQQELPALLLLAGVSVGLLMRLRWRVWPWFMASTAVLGFAGGALAYGLPISDSGVWALSMTVQTLAVAIILRWRKVTMDRARDPVLTLAVAAVVVAVVAFLSVLGSPMRELGLREDVWAQWWGTSVLAIVLAVPLLLLLGRTPWPRGRLAAEATAWSVATILGVVVVYGEWLQLYLNVWIWLMVAAPLLVLFAVRFGTLTAFLLLLVVARLAAGFTQAGFGPFSDPAVADEPVRTLQAVYILLAVCVQAVALWVVQALGYERRLARQQALFTAVIEGSPVPTVLLDSSDDSTVMLANRAFRDDFLADDHDVSFTDFFPDDEVGALRRLIASVDAVDQTVGRGEFTTKKPGGGTRLTMIRVAAVVSPSLDHEARGTKDVTRVIQLEDITEARVRETRLHRAATTDPLTGLANRRRLIHVLGASLPRVDAQRLLGLAYIDLDRFKAVNDRFGHATGDRLLCEVAACLLEIVRPTDLVARVGGDEFIVVSPGLPDEAAAEELGQRIVRRLGTCASPRVGVSASVGVCVTSDSGIEPEELLRLADRQMYRAKATGQQVQVSSVQPDRL
jgi:diguanylate cyclase (GGDEF)-like protein